MKKNQCYSEKQFSGAEFDPKTYKKTKIFMKKILE